MKLPRDISGIELAKALSRVGYVTTRQTGSHVRLTLSSEPQHHITIPAHQPLKSARSLRFLARSAHASSLIVRRS